MSQVLLWVAFVAVGSPAALAQQDVMSKGFTAGEFALLPEWCIDSQAGPYGGPEGGAGLNKSPRAGHWVGLMGADFWNMHHYCYALRDMLRLEGTAATPSQKKALQGRAISDLGYVVNTSASTMPLMPEVMLKTGELHLMQGNLPAAQTAFERSRALKPDYWPAYDRWIGVLIGLKRYDTARALAEEGLKFSPNQPNLRARLASMRSSGEARDTRKPQQPAKTPTAKAQAQAAKAQAPKARAASTPAR